jgi:hypothetical protein
MRHIFLAALGVLVSLPWAAQAEPLAEFKARLQRVQAITAPVLVQASRAKPKKGQKRPEWLRTQATLDDVRYDVRRTDSLVSPFVAWVELKISERSESYSSEAEARATTGPVKHDRRLGYVYRLDYAYRDSQWVFARGWCSLEALVTMENMRSPIDMDSGGCMSDKEIGRLVKPLLQ